MTMRLGVWDVVYPYDELVRPPKFKMWVCVSSEHWLFVRINSNSYDGNDVLILASDHNFLSHDSYVRCTGDLVEMDAVRFDAAHNRQGLHDRRGVVGSIASKYRYAIRTNIMRSPLLSPVHQARIASALSD